MKRPYTICHILSALDGKINGDFMNTASVQKAGEILWTHPRKISGECLAVRHIDN